MKADPVFALIEAHRAADQAHSYSVELYNALEARLKSLSVAEEDKHPDYIAWKKAHDAICATERRAMRKLCRTKPTTPAGISAVTLYLIQAWNVLRAPQIEVQAPDGDELETLLRSLAAAADTIAKRQDGARVLPFKPARKAA